VRVPHLATQILSTIAWRLSQDWQDKYGHPIYLLESFVQRDRFAGACYRAADWRVLGATTGRSRNSTAGAPSEPVKKSMSNPCGPIFANDSAHERREIQGSEMREAKFQRVNAARRGQFVHETFPDKVVRRGRQCPVGAVPQRRVGVDGLRMGLARAVWCVHRRTTRGPNGCWCDGWEDFTPNNHDNTNTLLLTAAKLGPYTANSVGIYKCSADKYTCKEGGKEVPRVRSNSMNAFLEGFGFPTSASGKSNWYPGTTNSMAPGRSSGSGSRARGRIMSGRCLQSSGGAQTACRWPSQSGDPPERRSLRALCGQSAFLHSGLISSRLRQSMIGCANKLTVLNTRWC
jgi:Domain of unknown function (DUF4338)